jgi:hypothetical protein
LPAVASYAASLPDAATTTVPSTTTGELEKPHIGTFTFVSVETLRDHTTAPVIASSAFRMPVAPNVYTRPSAIVGVARGPAPPFDSQKRVASRWRQTVWPVLTR